MWNISVISRGVEYNLSDNVNYLLTGLDGIGAAPVSRIIERGAMQHGESDVGYRLQSRRIALALTARGGSESEWFARRTEIMSIFRSSNTPVSLRLTSGADVRQIDCYLNGTMELKPETGTSPGWQRVGIELYCPDPTWYDPAGSTNVFQLGGGGDTTTVPLAVPMKVGTSGIDQSLPLQYDGTWDAYPVIRVVGPITGLKIRNETMGDKLDFGTLTIPAGETYIIDCRYGYKTVTRISDGANRIQDLTSDSNLTSFRIGAHPDVVGGANSIRVTGSGLTTASIIYLQYNTRYIGV